MYHRTKELMTMLQTFLLRNDRDRLFETIIRGPKNIQKRAKTYFSSLQEQPEKQEAKKFRKSPGPEQDPEPGQFSFLTLPWSINKFGVFYILSTVKNFAEK